MFYSAPSAKNRCMDAKVVYQVRDKPSTARGHALGSLQRPLLGMLTVGPYRRRGEVRFL